MKITLAKILEGLSHDALSFMAESNSARGSIREAQIPKVTSRINNILRRLAVRFVLQEKSVRVQLSPGNRYYSLRVGEPYILDDAEDYFAGDVRQILTIQLPNGRKHGLNDEAGFGNIMIQEGGTAFLMDDNMPVGTAVITYKAATPQFETDDCNTEQEIHLPEALINALYQGVAALTYQSMGGTENIALAQGYWGQFDSECDRAELGSAVETKKFEETNKFADRGFR